MHLLYINPYRDRDLDDPDQLLERYRSTRLWCEAVTAQGLEVTVWQAFPRTARREMEGVQYDFRPIPRRPDLRWPREMTALGPDVVHLDGLIAPLRLFRLCSACREAGVPAVIQDHGGRRGPGPSWKMAAAVTPPAQPAALLFSAAEQAIPWLNAGLFPRETPVLEVMESSTTFTPADRDEARAELGLEGDPLVVSVGRLNQGKDPVTLLNGFSVFAATRPDAHLALVYHEAPLLHQVEALTNSSRSLEGRVTLLGRLTNQNVRLVLSAGQIFVSASRHEGSGYAALESMACGAVPVLSDIPSFRAMTGGGTTGALFPAGDAEALSAALESVCRNAELTGWDRLKKQVHSHFQHDLGVEALGRKAVQAYRRAADWPVS